MSGRVHHVHHGGRPRSIPLVRQRQTPKKAFPLGNPYGTPAVHSLPGYFPVSKHPPIYRTRPKKLEGVFGPPLPPKPQPTHLNWGREFDIRTDSLPPVRTIRRSDLGEEGGEREYAAEDYTFTPQEEQQQAQQSQRHFYSQRQHPQQQQQPRYRRLDDGEHEYIDARQYQQQQQQQQLQHPHQQPQQPQPHHQQQVYKTVRDMDYARPQVILHVKDSGELFVPGRELTDPIVQPNSPTATLINTPLEELRRTREGGPQSRSDEGDDFSSPDLARGSQWLPDFSDALSSPDTSKEPSGLKETSKPKRQVPLHIPPAPPLHPPAQQHQHQQQQTVGGLRFEDSNTKNVNRGKVDQQAGGFSFPQQQQPKSNPVANTKAVRPFSLLKETEKTEEVRESNTKKRKVPSTVGKKESGEGSDTPNYRVVIGLTDTDEEVVKKAPQGSSSSIPERYTKQELYRLCIREVPDYLKYELCHHVLDDVRARARYIQKLKEREEEKRNPFKKKKDEEKRKAPVSGDPFAGIPKELPKATKAKVSAVKSMVKVYKPDKDDEEKKEKIAETKKNPGKKTTNKPEEKDGEKKKPEAKSDEVAKRPPPPPPKRKFQAGAFLKGLTAFFKSRLQVSKAAQAAMEARKRAREEEEKAKSGGGAGGSSDKDGDGSSKKRPPPVSRRRISVEEWERTWGRRRTE